MNENSKIGMHRLLLLDMLYKGKRGSFHELSGQTNIPEDKLFKYKNWLVKMRVIERLGRRELENGRIAFGKNYVEVYKVNKKAIDRIFSMQFRGYWNRIVKGEVEMPFFTR